MEMQFLRLTNKLVFVKMNKIYIPIPSNLFSKKVIKFFSYRIIKYLNILYYYIYPNSHCSITRARFCCTKADMTLSSVIEFMN
jgi:hypothetical protein